MVLVYIGKGCVCMRTPCDFIFVDNTILVTSTQIYMFANLLKFKIIGCNVNYSTPVTSCQFLLSSYLMNQDLLPIPNRMNLTLGKKLLQHDDCHQLLKCTQNNGHKPVITIHRDR